MARFCSAAFNYTVNRHYVFSKFKDKSMINSLSRFMLLAIVVMFANYGVIDFYYSIIGLSLVLAKMFTETTIFLFSYWFQRKFVFVK
ncbi:GtrA family protein [Niallia oryzisoli]|uniref:GtrA family protein n=1 Tax=Niallia oryzisoli TaxID=1737571 RepID=A0ABZ2CJE3_9BACI